MTALLVANMGALQLSKLPWMPIRRIGELSVLIAQIQLYPPMSYLFIDPDQQRIWIPTTADVAAGANPYQINLPIDKISKGDLLCDSYYYFYY